MAAAAARALILRRAREKEGGKKKNELIRRAKYLLKTKLSDNDKKKLLGILHSDQRTAFVAKLVEGK